MTINDPRSQRQTLSEIQQALVAAIASGDFNREVYGAMDACLQSARIAQRIVGRLLNMVFALAFMDLIMLIALIFEAQR